MIVLTYSQRYILAGHHEIISLLQSKLMERTLAANSERYTSDITLRVHKLVVQ